MTANDVVYGNVTGGKQFRGRLETTDPEAFRGNRTDHPSDLFVRGSAGSPYAGVTANNAQTVQQFYPESRNVAPPEGFIKTNPGTPGYIANPLPDERLNSADLRLGNPYSTPTIALPQPGQTLLDRAA